MYLSILKWLLLSYRLRLYGEATAVVMNFDEICRSEYRYLQSSVLVIILVKFVAEISTYHLNQMWLILPVNWPWVERVHFIDVSDVIDL